MKLRTGKSSEKETLIAITQKSFENSRSLESFIEQIQAQGHEIYFRNGVPSGIIGKRKYRFTSLGISLEKFNPEKAISNKQERER